MRVLIFSLMYYPRFVGGAEVAIKEITDRIAPEEIVFDMITLRLGRDLPSFEKVGNVNVYRVGWAGQVKSSGSLPWHLNLNKYAYLFTGLAKALSLSRKNKYDAIWSLMATYNSFAALFFKLLNPKVPFLFTMQDGDPIPYLKRRALPLYPFFKMIFTKADFIQAISRYLADWGREMGAKCPIEVVPNGVDENLFSAKEYDAEAESLKAALGKKSGDIFLITTSRLETKNAVGDIISSLAFLPEAVSLLILGIGSQEEELKGQAAEMDLKGRVRFLGYVPHKDMPPYLRASDIFVRPAVSEGLGNSFLEAMAMGMPIIGTPVGGIPDFLKDGETGLFCEVRNPESIASKVKKLISDEGLRRKLKANAEKLVKERYNWRDVSSRMKSILNRL